MARIAGINIPDNKHAGISLTYIYGIGRTTATKICEAVGVNPSQKVQELGEDKLDAIRNEVSRLTVEGDLRRERNMAVKRLMDLGCYRGIRHRRHRAQMIAREIAAYAAAQDLVLQEPYRTDSPDPAHLAWLFVRAQSPEQFEPFLLEIFRRYWSLALDASDLEAVAKFLAEFGLDSAAFLEWANREGTPALKVARVQRNDALGTRLGSESEHKGRCVRLTIT